MDVKDSAFFEGYEITIHRSVAEIAPASWNALLTADDLSFLDWEWYAALELSGSISVASGWQGVHIVVRRASGITGNSDSGNDAGQIVGIAPLYAKMHSWGELAFDHNWQHIAHQLGTDYFPKLVGMVPATPCSGYRFLIEAEESWERVTKVILYAIDAMVEKWKVKTVAFNFVDPVMTERLSGNGYCVWSHPGFSWRNDSFQSFDEYQQTFTKNQRRNIRRERKSLAAAGLRCEVVPASCLPTHYFQLMNRYYCETNEKFGPFAAHFLNNEFFKK